MAAEERMGFVRISFDNPKDTTHLKKRPEHRKDDDSNNDDHCYRQPSSHISKANILLTCKFA